MKHVRWDSEVSDRRKSSVKRLPQKPIRHLVSNILSRHHTSYDTTARYLKQYENDIRHIKREYRKAYPSFGIWRAFKEYAKSRNLEYRTGNVEDYMLSAMYPFMPLSNARILKPPGFSLKRT